MKTRNTLLLLLFLAVIAVLANESIQEQAAESGANWLTDFEAAQSKAAAENKTMLLDFTGSDWCIWCIRLKDEVFTQQAFVDYAGEKLVLVRIDFPKKQTQPDALKKQNASLAEKYGIRGFPTVVLLSPVGELIETTGYRRGGPESYVAHLRDLLAE